MKKLIAFDLDGTLAPSKSTAPDRIVEALSSLLEHFDVCVISGGKFGQFETQLLSNLKVDAQKLKRLHIMPTCGTRYYRYHETTKDWQKVYAEDFSDAQKEKIITAIEASVQELGFHEKQTWGPQVEDRGSQISWSALGQDIVTELGDKGVELKEKWDPDSNKKSKLRAAIAPRIPEFEVRMGGGTTIDITKLGIDKAYGMRKLMDILSIKEHDILFFGDKLQEGGNDYPVKAMGIDSLEVSQWQDTAIALEAILHVL